MIKLNFEDTEWINYTPEWNNNRKSKDPITCQIKYISQEDQDQITDALIGQQRDGFKSKSPVKWSKAQHDMVNNHVKDIKNVIIVKGEKEKEVKTMGELYKLPMLKGLYSEIAEALDASNRLEDFEAKN